jgi:hypothetical protein
MRLQSITDFVKQGGVGPFEKLFGRKPSVNKFRPFGCLAYVFQHEIKRKKLDSKSIPCILLATLEHGNYRVYDLATKKVYVSRHVVFSETEFPACIVTKKSRVDCAESQSDSSDYDISLRTGTDDSENSSSQPDSEGEEVEESSDIAADGDDEEGQEDEVDEEEDQVDQDDEDEHDERDVQGGAHEIADHDYAIQNTPTTGSRCSPVVKPRHRYPSRERKPPSGFWANVATRSTCHDIDNKTVLNHIRDLQQCHTTQPIETDTPSLKAALKSPDRDLWEAAIHEELESLRKAETWDEGTRQRA